MLFGKKTTVAKEAPKAYAGTTVTTKPQNGYGYGKKTTTTVKDKKQYK